VWRSGFESSEVFKGGCYEEVFSDYVGFSFDVDGECS